MDRVYIFDTTLRDGEQAPGASMTQKEKLEVAQQLARLNVDIIEAGFPISSEADFEAVKLIAKKIKGPVICGLARAIKKDIDAAQMALKAAKRSRIHVFLATSKIHMKYKLQKPEEEVLRLAAESVKYARKFTDDVEFSPEDATRTEKEFLYRVVEAAIKAGAKVINIPDTVGYAIPQEYGELISSILENVPNINKAIISAHCHDDLGMAVSNSLAAAKAGARQIECTINGIGERAGSASLEEIVMAIATRKDFFDLYTRIKKEHIYKTSKMVSSYTGFVVPPNKAIVGQNAFRHESGIHVHGIIKKRLTYEIMKPEEVGFGKTQIVLGKHSGKHAVYERLKALGFVLPENMLEKTFVEFKKLAEKKKEIYDEDLIALVEEKTTTVPETYKIKDLHVTSGTNVTPTAKIRLSIKGKTIEQQATGDGPVDACYKAIDKITKLKGKLEDYSIHAITKGKEALGEVSIMFRYKGDVFSGRGASTDIIEASAKAYINAINRAIAKVGKKKRERLYF